MATDNGTSALFRLTGFNIEPQDVTVTTAGLRIGRAGDTDLPLNHTQISRQHARIFWQDDQFWIEDLNSSNGAWVNDARIRPSVPQQLRPTDIIRLGPFLLTYLSIRIPPPPLPTDPAFRRDMPELPAQAVVKAPPTQLGDSESPEIQVEEAEALFQAGAPAGSGALPPLRPTSATADTGYPVGIPRYRSSWLDYLPAIYSDDEFLGRYLLIFESIFDPIIWTIDNFDLYFTPDLAPEEWLRWMASWFDLLLIPDLPIERQRAIVSQIGWLFLRRGTRSGLERLLELYFGVRPEIIENRAEPGHFVVKLPLSESNVRVGREIVEQLIASQKPAFASHTLETT